MSATPPPQQNKRPAAGTRRYRSKTQRPCDLCRTRKVLCNIPDPSQPCQLCERTGRECTFIGIPPKKRRDRPDPRRAAPSSTPMVIFDDETTDSPGEQPDTETQPGRPAEHRHVLGMMDDSIQPSDMDANMDMLPMDGMMADAIWSCERGDNWDFTIDPSLQIPANGAFDMLQHGDLQSLGPSGNHGMAIQETAGQTNTSTSESPSGPSSGVERSSLDQKPNYFTQFVGFSNESDPFLLQQWPYNTSDEVGFFMVTYRKPATSANPPVHFLQSKTDTATQARDLVDRCLSIKDDRSSLEQLVDAEMGVTLVRLYFKFVFEALPILSRSMVLRDEQEFVKTAPVGLLAAIYAVALPFTAWDEQLCLNNAYSKPNASTLWQISYTCLQREMQFPQLSTIQLFILLLNHTPFDPVSVESPFMWSLASSMLAMAQSLGLNIDPTGWRLLPWEIRLRRRLWWSVVVEHSWRAITHGRSSLLHNGTWNVTPLKPDDFVIDSTLGAKARENQHSPDYIMWLCSLTGIANDICWEFFSLQAVSQPQSLEELLEKARGPRQRLLEWFESLPESLHIPNKSDEEAKDDAMQIHGSLHVAYFTTHILVLRALLRPIIDTNSNLDHLQSSVGPVLQASRGLMQTTIKFIRGLDIRYQSAFWPAYTRHCFSYPGLFCYMLCLQQREPHMRSHDQNLLATWRTTLRTRVQAWPLLRFSTIKVDALFWKKLHQMGSSGVTGNSS